MVLAKVAAGLLALAVVDPSRARGPATLAAVGGTLLALYGGVLVLVGALVLADVIVPDGEVDERTLRWHVLVWDLWFVVWGVALAVAGVRARRLRSR